MRVTKDEALKKIEQYSPELCQAIRTTCVAFPGARLVKVSQSGSCLEAPEGHYLATVGRVTAIVELPKRVNFGWRRTSAVSHDTVASSDAFKKVASHGLERKSRLSADAYQQEIE